MQLHRIGIKVPMADGANLSSLDFIQVFHQWIQNQTLSGTLIDVADYSHVQQGPGILLITHAGNYAVDDHDGRRGLSYYSKRELAGDLLQRIREVTRRVLQACVLLEQEPRFAGKLRFNAGELELFANDRLAAPNNADTAAAIGPVVQAWLGSLHPGRECGCEYRSDGRDRFSMRLNSGVTATAEELLGRL
jgi:hypothetical protein